MIFLSQSWYRGARLVSDGPIASTLHSALNLRSILYFSSCDRLKSYKDFHFEVPNVFEDKLFTNTFNKNSIILGKI